MNKLIPCPYCGEAWLYNFTHHDEQHTFGYKAKCKCGHIQSYSIWKATKEEATKYWNDKVKTNE